MEKVKYSIIIPTYTEVKNCLLPLLDSIILTTQLDNVEVIIVANGTSAEDIKLIQEHPIWDGNKVILVQEDEPMGYAAATNLGLSKAEGEYLILINDDVIFQEYAKGIWIDMLEKPFKENDRMAITGVLQQKEYSINAEFLLFFLVMISRKAFEKIGYLDERFEVGAMEDVDYCIRARQQGFRWELVGGGNFPVIHLAEETVGKVPNWEEIFQKNRYRLASKYSAFDIVNNNWERFVIGKNDEIPPVEKARYEYMQDVLKEKTPAKKPLKIYEIGCGTGYGTRYLPEGCEYVGYDYSDAALGFARREYGETAGVRFEKLDLELVFNKENPEKYFEGADAIIAYEVLEHLHNGKEIAQKLKELAPLVLITIPKDEEPGFWGPHHILHHLTEEDFPGYDFRNITYNGMNVKKDNFKGALLLGTYVRDREKFEMPKQKMNEIKAEAPKEKKEAAPKREGVMAYIPTKGRTDTTLATAILSIIEQTVKPKKLLIIDDNEERIDLRQHPVIGNLLEIALEEGIEWEVLFGRQKGPQYSHQMANEKAEKEGFEWCWRMDDDQIARNYALKILLKTAKKYGVGAVGPLVWNRGQDTKGWVRNASLAKDVYAVKVEDIIDKPNAQWAHLKGDLEVEHLYGTFIYRPGIARYNLDLSRRGHREETMFTHDIYLAGYKLYIASRAVVYHSLAPQGGIRSHPQADGMADEKIFEKYLENIKKKSS